MQCVFSSQFCCPEAEFKEFEQRLKFDTRFKHGWFHFEFVFSVSRFEPALIWNRFLADQ